jgi:hypothetical protein
MHVRCFFYLLTPACSSFPPPAYWCCVSRAVLAELSPLWFRFVSQIENESAGTTFWNSVWHPKGTNHKPYSKALRKMTSTVVLTEKTMGSLYTFPRRLFWRRWCPKLCKLSQHFFFDLVRNFPIHLVLLVRHKWPVFISKYDFVC